MKLLLDTHMWLWSVDTPERMPASVRQAIASETNDLWLSPISIWELTNLTRRKRGTVDRPLLDWLAAARSCLSWTDAPLTEEVALENARLNWAHPDPADRFLVATARVYDLTLVTADHAIVRSGLCTLLANA